MATFSKDFFAVLCCDFASHSAHVNMYLVFSEFTSSPVFLLATKKFAVLFVEFMFLPSKLTLST